MLDLVRERKIGTEIFVTVATLVAMFGGETLAGAVLMVIILIAEFIADLNMDRARVDQIADRFGAGSGADAQRGRRTRGAD